MATEWQVSWWTRIAQSELSKPPAVSAPHAPPKTLSDVCDKRQSYSYSDASVAPPLPDEVWLNIRGKTLSRKTV